MVIALALRAVVLIVLLTLMVTGSGNVFGHIIYANKGYSIQIWPDICT